MTVATAALSVSITQVSLSRLGKVEVSQMGQAVPVAAVAAPTQPAGVTAPLRQVGLVSPGFQKAPRRRSAPWPSPLRWVEPWRCLQAGLAAPPT